MDSSFQSDERGIVGSVIYCPNFLQHNGIDPNALFNEILRDKAQFFQPRDVNYMKYRGNEIKRTKAFIYDGDRDRIPIYLYPGFVYESVLHYATCQEYGGMLMQVKDIIENYLQQRINHIIITKYDQPEDCIGWHNDKAKTIADGSVIAVISLGASRRFQLRESPTEMKLNPSVLTEIVTESGSYIGMSYDANIQYQHCVAPFDASQGDEAGTRISIVFRQIKNLMRFEEIEAKVNEYHKRNLAKLAITLTFGDRAENHRGMQVVGESAKTGFTLSDLQRTAKFFQSAFGIISHLIPLHQRVEFIDKPVELPEAYLLIIPKGAWKFVNYDVLCEQMLNLEWDTQAKMYGRVVNKIARHNLCFDDEGQEPDVANGRGTVIAFLEVLELTKLRCALMSIVPHAGDLKCEGNYYYDIKKCGIGYHGDSERKKVIGVRLGALFPLCFQWFHDTKPITKRMEFLLGEGDMYIMSDKTVGYDWKKRTIPTLRHSAGCDKFTIYSE